MPKLTKRSLGITDGYSSNYKRDELVQKLGAIEHRGVNIAQNICDHVCRYPNEADDYEMDSLCEACPVTRLMELID